VNKTGLLFLGYLFAVNNICNAQGVPEYGLKVAYLYNFALLTTWPTESSAAMVFCVLENDPMRTHIEALQAKKVRNRPIIMKWISAPEEARACDVLYLDAAQHELLPKVVESVRNLSILTVTDSPDPLRTEMAINLRLEGNKLVFDVNIASVRRARLSLSSRLLSLARNVK
jgi:hypothetical protein